MRGLPVKTALPIYSGHTYQIRLLRHRDMLANVVCLPPVHARIVRRYCP